VKTKLTILLAALLLMPVLATAAPKKRPLLLQPVQDEMAAKGEITKDIAKVLKKSEICMQDDKRWDKALQDQGSITEIYEMLRSAVFCWQNAEKKSAKIGEAANPAGDYVQARARYIEAFRSYLWGIEAKLMADRLNTCKRLKVAAKEAATAIAAADGLVDKFSTDDGKALAQATAVSSAQLGNTIGEELKRQQCQ
jgi:hypothetical protein